MTGLKFPFAWFYPKQYFKLFHPDIALLISFSQRSYFVDNSKIEMEQLESRILHFVQETWRYKK